MNTNEILYSKDNDATNIVSVYANRSGKVTIWRRENDNVEVKTNGFWNWFILADNTLLDGISDKMYQLKELNGDHPLKWGVFTKQYAALEKAAVRNYNAKYNTSHRSFYDLPNSAVIHFPATEQYLIGSGRTYFKGMDWNDLHRLQFDLETYSLDPKDGGIFLLAISDNSGYERIIDDSEMSEAELIRELCRIIQQRDPDIIENHNIFAFDLPFLEARAKIHNINLTFGRDGTRISSYQGTLKVAESTEKFTRYSIRGREIIDTLHAVKRWNGIMRELKSEGLKEAAQYFGIASPGREYIDGDKIAQVWKSDPEIVKRYALDDVREVAALSDLLMGDKFILAQMVPMPFEKIATAGTASCLDSLMVRAYLSQSHSLPQSKPKLKFKGGETQLIAEGVVQNVLHADVSSMYPSIMLNYDVKPENDNLDVFLTILRELTNIRLDAKGKLKSLQKNTHEYNNTNALQSAMKILINSAFGYMGATFTVFNDPKQAGEVTRYGREILTEMLTAIRDLGGQPIEADTDGIYLALSDNTDVDKFIKEINNKVNREGINIDGDEYTAMFSIAKKSYALLTDDGKVVVKGGGLKSRDTEPFLTEFLSTGLECLLRNDVDGLRNAYANIVDKIRDGKIEVDEISKTTKLSKSVAEYQNEHKATQPHFEALIAAGITDLKKDERVSYYKARSGWKLNSLYSDDLDKSHYFNRLSQTARRFEKAFSRTDFHTLFNPEPDLFAGATDIIKPTHRIVESESKEWIELAHGIKLNKADPTYKVKRDNFWVEADDTASIEAFSEQFEHIDIYKSALKVISPTEPNGDLSQYPRCGDFFMEFEGDKENPDRQARTIKAAHLAYDIINELFGCADAIQYRHNGSGKSLYLFIPMQYFEKPEAVYNLNLKYKVVAETITKKLLTELQDIPDLTFYDNADRILRMPESIYPDGGYDVEIPKELIFNENWNDITEYSKAIPEHTKPQPELKPTQQTIEIFAEMTKEVKTDPPKEKGKVSNRRRVKRKQAQRLWEEYFRNAQAQCVVKLAEAVANGESIGFEGRNKLIWECFQSGYSETTIVDLFLAYGDPTRYGVLEEFPDGYRLKASFNPFNDIDLNIIDPSCEKVQQWCDWVNCYRAQRFRAQEQHEQLSFDEFREKGRTLLREAIDDESNYSMEYTTAIDGSMAAGKTYQIARKSIELTNNEHPTSVLAPTHSACSKVLKEVEKLGGVTQNVVCVHVFGQREDTCIPEHWQKKQACPSCKIFKHFFGKMEKDEEAKQKYAQRIRIQMGNKGCIIDLPELWEIANDYNACACVIGKILAAPELSDKLTALTVMPHAYIINQQNRSIITRRIRPEYVFVDEADMMIDSMLPCHLRDMQIASTRSRLDSLYSKPCGMQCDKCHVHFSDTYTNRVRPQGKIESATLYQQIGKPNRFGDFLKECLNEALELEAKSLIFPSLFLFDELKQNIDRIEEALSVVEYTNDITPDKYFTAIRDKLVKDPIEGVESEELYEGLSYEELDEKTGKMVAKEIRPPVHVAKVTMSSCIERAYFIPKEAFDPDGYIVDQEDPTEIGNISVSKIWASEGVKMQFKDTDSERRLKALLEFASFCEFAPRHTDDQNKRTIGMYFELRTKREQPQEDNLEESEEREINRKYGGVNACGIKLRYLDVDNYRGTVKFLRTRKTMMLSGTFLDRDRLGESLLVKPDEINYIDARVPMHKECLILHHNPDMGKLVRNLTDVSLVTFGNGHIIEMYRRIVENRGATKFLHYAINTRQGNMFYGNIAKDKGETNSIFYVQNECPIRIQIPDWCSPEVKHKRSENWLFIDKLRSPTSRAVDREQFDLLTVHRNGYPDWYNMMPQVSAIKQFVNPDVDLEAFIEYNRQRAVFQTLLRNPRNDQRHVSIYISGDLHYTTYPDYLRNRVIPTEILMDKLKAAYPDKFLSNRETQIELLARVAVGFLDGTISDIDDPTPVFSNFEFKGDYGKGMDARKVEVDLSYIHDDDKYLIESFVDEQRNNTDHAESYKWTIERLEHVKKCIAEKGYLDRVKDCKGRRPDWKKWIEHLVDKNFLEPIKIKVEGKKSKTGYKIAEKIDVD